MKAPAEIASSAPTATSSSGSAANGTAARRTAATSIEQAQAANVRMAVGEAAAQPVADRQGDEHDPDRVRPHDRRGAEVGSEQTHGGDLGSERPGPHHEDEDGKRRHSDLDHSYGRARAGRAHDQTELVARRPRGLWHPFTQQQRLAAEEPLIIERAEGNELIDTEGRRYIDGVSSLWCNVHGHRHPRIDAAVRASSRGSPTPRCSGLSHPPPSSWPRSWSSSPRRA